MWNKTTTTSVLCRNVFFWMFIKQHYSYETKLLLKIIVQILSFMHTSHSKILGTPLATLLYNFKKINSNGTNVIAPILFARWQSPPSWVLLTFRIWQTFANNTPAIHTNNCETKVLLLIIVHIFSFIQMYFILNIYKTQIKLWNITTTTNNSSNV